MQTVFDTLRFLLGVLLVAGAPAIGVGARAASPVSTSPVWTAESNQASAFFGASVASAGDVNGDGFADIVVGAYAFDGPASNEGRAFLYLGSSSGPQTSPAWTAEADEPSSYFGWAVASAGDVNGDGYSDVIVGAKQYGHNATFDGRVYVFHGSAAGLATTPAWTADSDQAGAQLGASAASAGDVNGDGYDDVVVGANHYSNGQTFEGRAYVYLGSASGLSAAPSWQAEGNQAAAGFGVVAASAGDVNGDGYSDVIIGAYSYDNGQTDEGRVFVYTGSASGLSTAPAWTAESNQAGAFFGYSVASAGDVNGDGYDDVIVGAVSFDNGQMNEGRAFVYHGSAAGLSLSPSWTAESDQAIAQFGFSVASAGDVNGDGYDDVIIGGTLFDNGQTDEGRAWIYLGSPAGLAATPAWTAEPDVVNAQYGYSVASAGDVNGDGLADVIVGAHDYANGQSSEGSAYVYLGVGSGSPAGRVPDGSTGAPLGLAKAGAQIALTWSASCLPSDADYEIYEGTIGGTFTSHVSIVCTTGNATSKTLTPAAASSYYLVVPQSATREGSYGKTSAGVERSAGASACLPRQIGSCP